MGRDRFTRFMGRDKFGGYVMTETHQNFTLYQGQDHIIYIYVVDEDDNPKTMTGGTPSFNMYYDPDADAADVVLSITGANITLVDLDGTADGVKVVFEDTDSEDKEIGQYYYEVWVVDTSSNENLVSTGWVTIKPSPTKKT